MFKTKKARSESVPADQTYNSSEVARIAGVSLRQLQWWDERKVVSPRHEGHKRIYRPAEVIEVTVIAELRRKGFSLQKIRRVLRFLQREMGRRLADVLIAEADLHLLLPEPVPFAHPVPGQPQSQLPSCQLNQTVP